LITATATPIATTLALLSTDSFGKYHSVLPPMRSKAWRQHLIVYPVGGEVHTLVVHHPTFWVYSIKIFF
jgi:hypothetical protein